MPFASNNGKPLELLQKNGIEYVINPLGRKLNESELAEMLSSYDGLIAGTEPISAKVLQNASRLKHISRVGIGLDSVDLVAARERSISVSYTPDAPSPAVAELTIGLIFALLRSINRADREMHGGNWTRYFGHRITDAQIGVIGLGRIGGRVVRHLLALGATNLLVNDLLGMPKFENNPNITFTDKDEIYRNADLVSLHVPLSKETYNLVRREQLSWMKNSAYIINTSRGGIVNEMELYKALNDGIIAGAAIDVFEQEPYSGILAGLPNCILTSHMGSMSYDCRQKMELEATEESIRFFSDEKLLNEVPEAEFLLQAKGLK